MRARPRARRLVVVLALLVVASPAAIADGVQSAPADQRAVPMKRLRRLSLACWIAAIVWVVAAPEVRLAAQLRKPLDYEVKAVYLLNFARFATWPAASTGGRSFDICVLGRDPFGSVLETTVAGEAIDGKPVIARRIGTPRDAMCRILFVSDSERRDVKTILPMVERTLTVSDVPGLVEQGGMIEFVVDAGKVRFAVNAKAAEAAGLTLSSQLLRVALKTGNGPAVP